MRLVLRKKGRVYYILESLVISSRTYYRFIIKRYVKNLWKNIESCVIKSIYYNVTLIAPRLEDILVCGIYCIFH